MTTNRVPADNPIDELLRNAACVALNDDVSAAIREACDAQNDWSRTIREAELHGMAPYMYMRIKQAGASLPDDIRRKLAALTFRHSDAIGIRSRAVTEITRRLRDEDIDVLVLKGAALAHLIYPQPGLRPMSDVDVLVAPRHLERAAELVSALGYGAAGGYVPPADHHHLATVSRTDDGLRVSVEIHHDALAPDNIGSIRLGSLSEPARAFTVDGTTLHTLGHIDTLRHLCRHALEPREAMKIGSALDIMLYASTFADDIDWPRLEQEFPEVITMLQLLGYLVPRPPNLEHLLPAVHPTAPEGVGVGMVPLSRLRRRSDLARKLFNPSDWWLRGFYNVRPGRSLVYTKGIRHPARVLFWLWRRAGKG